MTGNETVWETPETQRLGRPPSANYEKLAADLRANPGAWALVGENLSVSIGSHITSGRIKAFQPAGSFEGAVRGSKNGRAEKVFARFIGD